MRLEWIDDILAVLDQGSLARAAEQRFVTQSAFTRRVRMIEENIGATLFDRRRKPVGLLEAVQELEPELRDLSARLHALRQALKRTGEQTGKPVTFACQHALTATISPLIVRNLTQGGEATVRVRSANKDECLVQLASRVVDFAVMYGLPEERAPRPGGAFEAVTLGADLLVPVCAPALRDRAEGPDIPIIAYPSEVFLGQIFGRMIAPRLPRGSGVLPVAETALTLAGLQFALNEIGIAWLPLSLAASYLRSGGLVRVDDVLPSQPLSIRMIRLSDGHGAQDDAVWQHLVGTLRMPGGMLGGMPGE